MLASSGWGWAARCWNCRPVCWKQAKIRCKAQRVNVREETGMAAAQLEKLGEFYLAAGYCNEFMTVYLARGLYPAPLQQDADEFLNLVKLPVREAFSMARRGEILDSKTLASLLLAEEKLG